MKKLEIGGIYKHYKGTKVKILAEGFHSETLEPQVIYMHLEDGVIWVRPKKMFLEKVKIGNPERNKGHKHSVSNGTGKIFPRFQKINQKIIIKPK